MYNSTKTSVNSDTMAAKIVQNMLVKIVSTLINIPVIVVLFLIQSILTIMVAVAYIAEFCIRTFSIFIIISILLNIVGKDITILFPSEIRDDVRDTISGLFYAMAYHVKGQCVAYGV